MWKRLFESVYPSPEQNNEQETTLKQLKDKIHAQLKFALILKRGREYRMGYLTESFHRALYEEEKRGGNSALSNAYQILMLIEMPPSFAEEFDDLFDRYFIGFFRYVDIENKKKLFGYDTLKAELREELEIDEKDNYFKVLLQSQIKEWTTNRDALMEFAKSHEEWLRKPKWELLKSSAEESLESPARYSFYFQVPQTEVSAPAEQDMQDENQNGLK